MLREYARRMRQTAADVETAHPPDGQTALCGFRAPFVREVAGLLDGLDWHLRLQSGKERVSD